MGLTAPGCTYPTPQHGLLGTLSPHTPACLVSSLPPHFPCHPCLCPHVSPLPGTTSLPHPACQQSPSPLTSQHTTCPSCLPCLVSHTPRGFQFLSLLVLVSFLLPPHPTRGVLQLLPTGLYLLAPSLPPSLACVLTLPPFYPQIPDTLTPQHALPTLLT